MGTPQGDQILFAYGTITLCGRNFHNRSAKHWFCNSLEGLLPFRAGPTTPLQHRQQAVPLQRFGHTFRFARRYSGSRCCFPFLGVLRCFNSPGSLRRAYFIQPGVTGHLPLPGFPIRRSTDRSLVDGSPWLIAVTHVLHRHLAPRHPPLALCSLESSRCSCSLCSSQGAVRFTPGFGGVPRNPECAWVTARCCHAAPADPMKRTGQGPHEWGPGAVPSKRNSDDR